jgi:methanogenic corrinoid protein MtbC1/DNA-binding XRE family transcriptional regulator
MGAKETLNLSQLQADFETVDEFLHTKRSRFAEAILTGDPLGATQIVDELLVTRQTLSDIYVHVIAPSLVELGKLWCQGEASTGEEKLATQIVLDQMERLRALFIAPGPRSPYRVMVACVEGEHHFIGARMTADLCASHGWNVDFLGHNVPDPSVIEMVQRRRPHVLALSVTMASGLEHVRSLINLMAEAAPNVRLVVGGSAVDGQSKVATRSNGLYEIANDLESGIGLIGALLRADRPKSVLKEYQLVLARRVRNLRTQRGWTQEHLAEVTQVTRACINAVEGGKQNVSMDILVRMANALEVAPEKLLSAEG